jgi:hypothetical protein
LDHLPPHAGHRSADLAFNAGPRPLTAAERVLASELQGRSDANDALSMMVSSMARMVQAGKGSQSRWNAS